MNEPKENPEEQDGFTVEELEDGGFKFTPIEPAEQQPDPEPEPAKAEEKEEEPEPVQYIEGWDIAKQPAKKFRRPTLFQTQAHLLYLPTSVPTVFIEKKAAAKIHIMLSQIELEVGWLGTAERLNNDFIIKDVFLFGQDVSYGHSELSTDSMAEIMTQVVQEKNGEYIFNNTRFWGHSHGNGGTEPSTQDVEQMDLFEKFGADFFLRGIFNRNGQVTMSVMDWERNIAYHRLPWTLTGKNLTQREVTRLENKIRKEMKKKVKYRRRVITKPKFTPRVYVPRNQRQSKSWNPITMIKDLIVGGND